MVFVECGSGTLSILAKLPKSIGNEVSIPSSIIRFTYFKIVHFFHEYNISSLIHHNIHVFTYNPLVGALFNYSPFLLINSVLF